MQDQEVGKCSICGEEYTRWGNNARPVNDGRCCDMCNDAFVIPKRIELLNAERKRIDAKRIDSEN